jgi:hypothetical protein
MRKVIIMTKVRMVMPARDQNLAVWLNDLILFKPMQKEQNDEANH